MFHYQDQSMYHHGFQQLRDHSSSYESPQIPSAERTVSFEGLAPVVTPTHPPQRGTSSVHSRISDRCRPVGVESKASKKELSKSPVDTSTFTVEQRLVAAVWVHERKRTATSISRIKHDFRQRFGCDPPAKNTLLVWERKLFSSGSVCDAPRTGRPVNRCTRVSEVATSLRCAPTLSLRARAAALHVPRTTLRTILRKDLAHIFPSNEEAREKSIAKSSLKKVKNQRVKKAAPGAAPPCACLPQPALGYT